MKIPSFFFIRETATRSLCHRHKWWTIFSYDSHFIKFVPVKIVSQSSFALMMCIMIWGNNKKGNRRGGSLVREQYIYYCKMKNVTTENWRNIFWKNICIVMYLLFLATAKEKKLGPWKSSFWLFSKAESHPSLQLIRTPTICCSSSENPKSTIIKKGKMEKCLCLLIRTLPTGLKSRDATTVFSNQNDDCVSEQWKILRTRNVYTTNRCNTQKTLFPWNRYPKLSLILTFEVRKLKSPLKALPHFMFRWQKFYHFSWKYYPMYCFAQNQHSCDG